MEKAKIAQVQTALARFEAGSAQNLRDKLQDKHFGATNWLVASLFTINGAGALQLVGGDESLGLPFALAAICFVFGLLFCFGAVVFVQFSDRHMIPAMHSWGLFWTAVAEGGEYDSEEEMQIKEKIRGADRIGRFSRLCLIMAAADFLFGVSFALTPKLAFLH